MKDLLKLWVFSIVVFTYKIDWPRYHLFDIRHRIIYLIH